MIATLSGEEASGPSLRRSLAGVFALLAAFLDRGRPRIIAALPDSMHTSTTDRLEALVGRADDPLAKLASVLSALTALNDQELSDEGPRAVAAFVDTLPERQTILDVLAEHDPEIAATINTHRFEFEDLVMLDDRGVQVLFSWTDRMDWAKALKGAEEVVLEKVMRSLPDVEAHRIEEELDLLGPIQESEVKAARSKLCTRLLDLEREGRVVIARSDGDELIV